MPHRQQIKHVEFRLDLLSEDRHHLGIRLLPLPGVEFAASYRRADLEAIRDAWLAEPQPSQAANPARAIIDLVNDDRTVGDLATPNQWHTLAEATLPADLVWGADYTMPHLYGQRRPLLGWLDEQHRRLASDPRWHDAAPQLADAWATIEQTAQSRIRTPNPDQGEIPLTPTDPRREPPSTGRPGPDISPSW